MALTKKPKARMLVRKAQSLALIGGLALTGCTESNEPADGGPEEDVEVFDGMALDTPAVDDGGVPRDAVERDVALINDAGVPPMPPPRDAGGREDVGIIIGSDGGFDGGLPPTRDVGPRP